MANIKSQKKRIITAEKARVRNKAVRSELKTAIKKVRKAVEEEDVQAAQELADKAGRLLDKAASKGIIHKNQAAQRKNTKLFNGSAQTSDFEMKLPLSYEKTKGTKTYKVSTKNIGTISMKDCMLT